jgi:tetratricopeptide (TPR) repeat protein
MSIALIRPTPMPRAAHKAQTIAEDAWDMQSDDAVTRAKAALEVCPDCDTAYDVLARHAATPEAKMASYQKAIGAFRKWHDQRYFAKYKGSFWLYVETRAFMVAMAEYGKCLWGAGLSEAAIDIYRSMLALNPNDNQGVRYTYLSWLIMAGHLKDARLVAAAYHYFPADVVFDTLLLNILENKGEKIIKSWYDKAVKANEFIIPFILKTEPLPETLPDRYGFGDKDEAAVYMTDEYGEALWGTYPAAVTVLKNLSAP